jgi:hypothetical protein
MAPKVVHQVVWNSAVPISDDDSSSSENNSPATTPAKRKVPASHVVSKPRHKPASTFQASTASSLSAVGDYLQQRTIFDHERLEELKEKRVVEVKREKLEMAKALLATPDLDDEMKAAAKQVLLDFVRG